ncbi:MAG: hypothetical protein O6930_04870 [Gammaproteobacteria bacterium]|nr:hypothetical protein [Gammaproteobacteria bacterium]
MKHHKMMASLILALGYYVGCAHAHTEIIEFSDSRIIIEINATDGDSGIQMFVDGEGWDRLIVFDPKWKRVLRVRGSGGVGDTGLTEFFFESAEPGFDELPLEEFLERFPEGKYRFFGASVEGNWLFGTGELTHNFPAGPELLLPAEDSVVAPGAVTVMWSPVTTQFGGGILEGLVGYQVIVEQEDPLRVFSADVTADVTSIVIPPSFMRPGVDYKFEVLAIEASGNQTLSEREFSTLE